MKNKSTDAVPWDEVRDWKAIKDELKSYMDADPRSKFEIIEKAGLSRDAYYKLFPTEEAKDSEKKANAPMRRATVEGLAKALNLTCMFSPGGWPTFSAADPLAGYLNNANTKEAVKYAIEIAGSLELLSEKADISTSELESILKSDSQHTPTSLHTLHRIAQAIDRTLIVFGDDSITLVNNHSHGPSASPTTVKLDLSTLAHVGANDSPRIMDEGLKQLVFGDSGLKHEITENEIKMLSQIQDSSETDGTLTQWTNILYSIRGLNTI
jgi:hypothetical protein